MLTMVWETSPPLVSSSIALRFVRALLPIATLWVAKLIIDAVVARSSRIWTYVGIELALAILGDVLGRLNALGDSLLADRFTNRISVRLMQHATRLDLVSFEDPVFYDKLERARRQTTGRLTLLASLLNICQDSISLLSLSAGLILFSPWLMVLLVAAVIPAFLGETHFTSLAYSVLYKWTPQRRELDYLRFLGASSGSAKEIKIFGLGDYLADRYRNVSDRVFQENRAVAIKRATVGSLLNLISTGGYYGAYMVILMRTLAGGLTLGTLTFLTGAFSRSRMYIEKILSGFTDVSEQALFLKDLFEFFEMQPAIRSLPGALPAPRPIRDGFRFENVAFAYAGASRAVLKQINFHSGSRGKSGLNWRKWSRKDYAGEAACPSV